VPCERSVVNRVQSFLNLLETDLPPGVMEKVGYAFRELLNNAIEWGGHLDPNLKVRISYIRTNKMLMYRLDDPAPGSSSKSSSTPRSTTPKMIRSPMSKHAKKRVYAPEGWACCSPNKWWMSWCTTRPATRLC